MGRKLPWKTSPTQSSPEKKPSLKSESPHQTPSRLLNTATGSPSASTRKPRHDRVVESEDGTRSPSTSPPPEPPPERFMRPGLDHDDRYRMVEDEFLSMAHQFTVHLHRAEYNRLKNLAKQQNADTIREIERPIVGPPTLLARQRQETAHRISKQRKLLASSSREKDASFAGSSLQGLMESPRKEHKWISAGLADAAKTRASAGFDSQKITPVRMRQISKPSSGKKKQISLADDDETEDGEDLDLATPSRKPATKAARSVHASSPVISRSAPRPAFSTPRALSTTMDKTSRSESSVKRPTTAPGAGTRGTAKRSDVHEDIDDDDLFGITKRISDRRRSRGLDRRTEEKAPSKPSLDEIPSFI
ncbi:hypothetical protein FLAG1_04855 [Fusarium langsethiae]|uniref:Uncharacterized protein n=1 Tax=Fusarium langsethiae TaxID=179993 RepID=A0A0M9EY49_FUSLA|nr:hypothetical protein FLAG1_04855 [Fusarium langsethiae]GKU20899.1 unnamed protein product [Fusarium langsethiae]